MSIWIKFCYTAPLVNNYMQIQANLVTNTFIIFTQCSAGESTRADVTPFCIVINKEKIGQHYAWFFRHFQDDSRKQFWKNKFYVNVHVFTRSKHRCQFKLDPTLRKETSVVRKKYQFGIFGRVVDLVKIYELIVCENILFKPPFLIHKRSMAQVSWKSGIKFLNIFHLDPKKASVQTNFQSRVLKCHW